MANLRALVRDNQWGIKRDPPAESVYAPGSHGYYETLIARADHWKSVSLRNQAQITSMLVSPGGRTDASYNPAGDTDPHAQDALKVAIPPFFSTESFPCSMAAACDADDTELNLANASSSGLSNNVTILIDSELMSIIRPSNQYPIVSISTGNPTIITLSTPHPFRDGDPVNPTNVSGNVPAFNKNYPCTVINSTTLSIPFNTTTPGTGGIIIRGWDQTRVLVQRAQYGTTATSHSSGALVKNSTNSLYNQVRFDLGTSDGNTYLFTWDDYFTDSYLHSGLSNHKTYQFTSKAGYPGSIWQEPATRYVPADGYPPGWDADIHICEQDWRAYQNPGGPATWDPAFINYMGPLTTLEYPVRPKVGVFLKHANRWTRHWVRFQQRLNDYDIMDYWVADEQQVPMRIYDTILVNAWGGASPSIHQWWIEYNTSTSAYVRGNTRDLVSYVRNFVALVNPPSDISSLLVKPE